MGILQEIIRETKKDYEQSSNRAREKKDRERTCKNTQGNKNRMIEKENKKNTACQEVWLHSF